MHIIKISGTIGLDISADDVREQLAGHDGEDIEVQIAGPGGIVSVGLEIFNIFRMHNGHITMRIMGEVASMTSYITMAGDKILAFDNSVLMIHNPTIFSFGDHNELKKTSEMLESFRDLLAKAFSKKSGLNIKEINRMMDEETFLFGDEIKEKGFADEIIKTDKDKVKNESVAFAKAEVENCITKLKKLDSKENDLEKAAAFLEENKLNFNAEITSNKNKNNSIIPPNKDEGEKPKPNGVKMNLEEALKDNPQARIDLDKLLNDNKTKIISDEKEKNTKVITKVVNVLNSDSHYPDAMKGLALNVIKGESTIDALDGAIAVYDSSEEGIKAKAAKKETKALKETPNGDGPELNKEDGVIKNQGEFEGAVKDMKKTLGREE